MRREGTLSEFVEKEEKKYRDKCRAAVNEVLG